MSIKNGLLIAILFCATSIQAQELLTQEKAVQLALDNNYGIKIANSAVEVAQNNTSIYNTGFLPIVTGNAGATIDIQNTEGQLANGETRIANGAETQRYNASINLNYTLFDGLGRRYNYKRLKEQYQLSQLQARETIENTVIQLFSVYYNVAQLTENKLALDETLVVSKDRLQRAQYQFDYGQNTKLGFLNAEVDINNDSINIINANQQLINANRDLNVVLGHALS
ncbi:MAG: TolC family protein, partial [Olleya sp.]